MSSSMGQLDRDWIESVWYSLTTNILSYHCNNAASLVIWIYISFVQHNRAVGRLGCWLDVCGALGSKLGERVGGKCFSLSIKADLGPKRQSLSRECWQWIKIMSEGNDDCREGGNLERIERGSKNYWEEGRSTCNILTAENKIKGYQNQLLT